MRSEEHPMTTPIVSKRAAVYADVPDEKWNDWRWQLSHRLNTVEEIDSLMEAIIRVKQMFG